MASTPLPRPLVLALAFLLAGRAEAQPAGSEDERRSLIADAEAARDAGLHQQAAALGTRAGQLRWTPSLQMLVAQEHLAMQHGTEALTYATRCLVGAEADPSVRNRARIIAECRAIIDLLTPQMGHLRLRLPDPPPVGLRLRINGREIAREDWGTALPVLGGTAVIEGDGEGVTPFRTTTEVFAGAERELRLVFASPPPPPPPPPLPPPVDAGVRTRGRRTSSPR